MKITICHKGKTDGAPLSLATTRARYPACSLDRSMADFGKDSMEHACSCLTFCNLHRMVKSSPTIYTATKGIK